MNRGPSLRVYKSGWMAPRGLAGGTGAPPLSGVCPLDGISSGDKHLPRPAVLGEAGTGELQELAEPPVSEAKLDCDGDGVLNSPLTTEVPGEEERMSRDAARSGEGERLLLRSG